MAKVMNPLHSSEARGRVGGLVYNTWRGIRTVKTHTAPGHESDPLRQAHFALIVAAGQRWSSITPEQRASWNHFANQHPDIDWTSKPCRIAGCHWYIRTQVRLHDIGLGYIDNPPTAECITLPRNPDCHAFFGKFEFYWKVEDPLPPHAKVLDIWLAGPYSPGRNPTIHDAKRAIIELYPSGIALFDTWGNGWYTIFFRPIDDNGMIGVWQSYRQEQTTH